MLSLKLLGGATLEGEDGPLRGRAVHKRRLALLAVLSLSRGPTVGRERVIGLLWPDHSTDSARHLLSEALYVLRKELHDALFVSSGDEVGISRDVLRCDAAEFDEALERGDAAAAVALYRGPFLEGFYVSDAPDFERWAEGERDRLGRSFARAVEKLAEGCEGRGEWRAAAEWWRRLAAHDPCSSRVALRLMRALEAAGERAAAIRHAGVHAALVRGELGTEPDAAVQALAERLRAEPTPESAAPVPPAAAEARPGSADVPAEREAAAEKEAGSPGMQAKEDPARAPAGAAAVEEWAEPPAAAPPAPDAPGEAAARRMAAVWSAEVVGGGGGPPEHAGRVFAILQEAAHAEIRRAGGHPVELAGRTVLAEFSDARAAAISALRLVRELEDRARVAGVPATLRVGMHVGELATTPDGGIYGEAASTAARLQDRAEPGQVLVSEAVWTLLRGVPRFRFAPRGMAPMPGATGEGAVFDLQVERRRAAPGAPPRDAPPLAPPPRPSRRRRTAALAGVAAAAVLAIAAAAVLSRGPDAAPAALTPGVPGLPPHRIAVLYFEDGSPDGSLGHIIGGITDQFIDELARVPGLDVVPRNGVKPYRHAELPLDSIAKALRAGTLVEGSLQRQGGRVRLAVRVVDATGQTPLQSTVLERPADDLFRLQDDLAQEVSRFLRRRLGTVMAVQRRAAETRSSDARRRVFNAELLRREADTLTVSGYDTADEASALRLLGRADTLLAQAESLDPHWAEPATLRAWVAMDRFARAPDAGRAALARLAVSHADRALRRKDRHPAALEVRGLARWRLTLRLPGAPGADTLVAAAERDLRAATEADSLRASAWYTLSQLLRFRGAAREADLAARHAREADAYLDMEPKTLDRQFYAALELGDYPRARGLCLDGRALYPKHYQFVQCQLTLLAQDPAAPPDVEGAWSLVDTLNRVEPADTRPAGREYWPHYYQMMVAAVLARAGQSDSARAVMARTHAAVVREGRLTEWEKDAVVVWTLLGEDEKALDALDRYLRARPDLRGFMARNPALAGLRGHPRFRRAVEPGTPPTPPRS